MRAQQNAFGSSFDPSSPMGLPYADLSSNPYVDAASIYYPQDVYEAFDWAEQLFYGGEGTVKEVARRTVRYFLTDVQTAGPNETENASIKQWLEKDLGIMSQLAAFGENFLVYGNVISSLLFPIDRFLSCRQCGSSRHIDNCTFRFDVKNVEFVGTCPRCNHHGQFKRVDIRSNDMARIRLVFWNPKRMRIRCDPLGIRREYYYEFAPLYVQHVRKGTPFYVSNTPIDILRACCAGNSSTGGMYKFRQGGVFHHMELPPAGFDHIAWGIPPMLAACKTAYYIQLLRRMDQEIAREFVMPWRVFHPPAATGAAIGDGLMAMSGRKFHDQVQNMVNDRKRRLTSVSVSPFALGYQLIGGEAKALSPVESIELAHRHLLNACGTSAQMYEGNVTTLDGPIAVRLYEKSWIHLYSGMNNFLAWIVKSVAAYKRMSQDLTATLKSSTIADDLERKALLFQAAAGGDVSKATAYSGINLDFLDEQKKVLAEQRKISDMQREAALDQEATQLGASAGAAPSAPGAPPSGAALSLGETHETAKSEAQRLLFQVPAELRRGELMKIKQSNPTLHGLINQELANLRTEMSRQGGAAMLAQQQQAAQGGNMQVGATPGAPQ